VWSIPDGFRLLEVAVRVPIGFGGATRQKRVQAWIWEA